MHRRYTVNDQQKKEIDKLFRERDKLKNEIYNLLSITDPTHINITVGKRTPWDFDTRQVSIDEAVLVEIFLEVIKAVAENKTEKLEKIIYKIKHAKFRM